MLIERHLPLTVTEVHDTAQPVELNETDFTPYIDQRVVIDFLNGDTVETDLKGVTGSRGNLWLSVDWGIIDNQKIKTVSLAKPALDDDFAPITGKKPLFTTR